MNLRDWKLLSGFLTMFPFFLLGWISSSIFNGKAARSCPQPTIAHTVETAKAAGTVGEMGEMGEMGKVGEETASGGGNGGPSEGLELYLAVALKGTPLSLNADASLLQFPSGIKRVWIDVGVHKKSDFISNLDANPELFVIGYEPSEVWNECGHPRCVTLWGAATPDLAIVSLNIQKAGDLCNSMLKPNTDTDSNLFKGCVTQKTDKDGKPMVMRVPGLPLAELVKRVPKEIAVEYIKIDAQGYDYEVMKGALPATDRLQLVSLEAMDVKDKGKLLYKSQPTLDEIKDNMADYGWLFVTSISNNGVPGEVNGFFASNQKYMAQEHLDRLPFENVVNDQNSMG